MGMTYAQLVTAVQLRCFAGQNTWATNIKIILNMLVSDIARGVYTKGDGRVLIHYWNDLKDLNTQTLAIDGTSITLTNNRSVLKVRIADVDNSYTTLRERSIEQTDISSPYPAQTANRPSFYSMWGDTMLFDTKADQAYTVYARRYIWPTDMVADASTPTITGIDDVIIAKTCADVFASRQGEDSGEAVYWSRKGDELYLKAVEADASKQFIDGPVAFVPGRR